MTDTNTEQAPFGTRSIDQDLLTSDPFSAAWTRYVAALAMTALATIVAIGVDKASNIPNLSLVFVIPVIVAGAGLGLGPSLCAALLGALSFNFFLTEPRYSLAVDDISNIWAIALLFVVGVIASGVSFTSHQRAAQAALLKRQAKIVQDCSIELLRAGSPASTAKVGCRALGLLFGVPAVVLLVKNGKVTTTERTGEIDLGDAELDAALSSLTTGVALRSAVYPHVMSRFDFWPVRTNEGRQAVIGLAFDADERPAEPEVHVDTIANLLAFALDKQSEVGEERSRSA